MIRKRCCNLRCLMQRIMLGISLVGILASSNDWPGTELRNARVRLVNGSSIRATIKSIDSDGKITGSRIIENIDLGQITSIETGVESSRVIECDIRLIHGGFVNAKNASFQDDQVAVVNQDNQKSEIPIEAIKGIVWTKSDFVEKALANRSAEKDTVVVSTKRGEQKVQGFLESINDTHVVLNYQGKNRKIARTKVHAVLTAKLEAEQPSGVIAVVSTATGSQLQGAIRNLVGGKLELEVIPEFSIQVESEAISKIVIQSDRIQYLSDMQPLRYEQQTQFTANRNWQRDKSLLGNSLKLKYDSTGKVLSFAKGIGTRSYTAIVFSNENDFDQLRAVVGIDMETAGHGDCEMVVEGDGIRLWSKRVTGSSDPEPIVIDITGIREVALIVSPGANFDLADHADWADVRFTKSN